MEIYNPPSSAKILSQNKKQQDKQDSKIAYYINGSWYFKIRLLMENDIYLEVCALWYSVDWVLYVILMIEYYWVL